MSKIIFKQRHRDRETKKKYTPDRNAGKLEYIGDKPEALKNEISGNGLFGYVRGNYAITMDMKQEQSYLRKMTTPHRDIFHAVYSFTSTGADEVGLHTAKDWQDWTKYRISEIAKHMHKKIENIEWYASVHLKDGQPHVHLIWWDKAQQIAINVVDPEIYDNIRIDAIKNTNRGFYTELHNKEDDLLKEMRSFISEQTDGILNASELTGKRDLQIVAMLNRIYNSLPPKGQLKYKFIPRAVKNDLDKLTAYLIKGNPKLKSLYDDILDARRLYNEALHSSESVWGRYQLAKYEGQLNDDIKTGVGNTILKLLSKEKIAHRQRLYDALNLPEPDMKDFEAELIGSRQVGKHIYWSKDFKAARNAERQDNDIEKALELYQKEAVKGNVLAVYEIADLYRRGLVFGEDRAESFFAGALAGFKEVEKSNDKMRPYLQYRIGRTYFDGYGTEQNFTEAMYWLEKSALGGNHLSQYTVGKMYHKGEGTEVNTQKAEQYYQKAVNGGFLYANGALAKLYLDGSIPNSAKKGEILLLNILNNANGEYRAYIQYILGAAYHYNDGIRDDSKARELLTQSANSGNEYATALIARMDNADAANIANLLRSTLMLLRNASSSTNRALHDMSEKVFGRGDLSKEAIAELIYKLQDKQNTAEM